MWLPKTPHSIFLLPQQLLFSLLCWFLLFSLISIFGFSIFTHSLVTISHLPPTSALPAQLLAVPFIQFLRPKTWSHPGLFKTHIHTRKALFTLPSKHIQKLTIPQDIYYFYPGLSCSHFSPKY